MENEDDNYWHQPTNTQTHTHTELVIDLFTERVDYLLETFRQYFGDGNVDFVARKVGQASER